MQHVASEQRSCHYIERFLKGVFCTALGIDGSDIRPLSSVVRLKSTL